MLIKLTMMFYLFLLDAEIVFEANECRKTSRLPLTVDVLKVLSKAIQGTAKNSCLIYRS